MNNALVQLSFALPTSEDPLSAAMAHTMEYEQLHLAADQQQCIHVQCVLPEDAHVGDVISISATKLNARKSQYFTAHTLRQVDLDNHVVTLSLTHITDSDDFVIQIMLHGKYATLKDSAQFDVSISASEQPTDLITVISNNETKSQRFRHYLNHIGATFLALF
ncbi:hypothetical protein [Pseudoalteromonas mariniglutinosa]|uniref:hypothetical protein n=1 Tax=Pseudoalteromonas mariniglutinosa TaxID=206042 RepID=UPI00384A604E